MRRLFEGGAYSGGGGGRLPAFFDTENLLQTKRSEQNIPSFKRYDV